MTVLVRRTERPDNDLNWPSCVSGGNGAVKGQRLSIRLIDGSGVMLINPDALHVHIASVSQTYSRVVEHVSFPSSYIETLALSQVR